MKKIPNPKASPFSETSKSRRAFLKGAGLSAASFMIVPRHVLGGIGYQAPSDTLNIAAIGAGGMGASNMSALTSQNIVAIADVDYARVKDSVKNDNRADLKAAYDKAKWHKDYRKMLDEHKKDIDAVVIATPDHVHAVAAMACMKEGKHVYVQKPLTYTVKEARMLDKTAKETGVVTQMGNQGHSIDGTREIVEWIQDGAIGEVTEVHVWTNRPIWPQGVPAPTEAMPVPADMDWDLFLGPAPKVPYHSAYAPFAWRGWVDYGQGALGDMGAHLIDQPNWALKLGYPEKVHATSTVWLGDPINAASYPLASMITYNFPAREGLPPVKMTWYDGGLMPERPEELGPEEKLNTTGGVIMVGSKGKLMHETYGANPRLLPNSLAESYQKPKPTLPRITVSHEMNWVEACKGNAEISCPFSYAAPLNETMLLGMVALRAPGETLTYDSKKMAFDRAEVNQYLDRQYREGWSLA